MLEHSHTDLLSPSHVITSLPSLLKSQAQQTPQAIAIAAPGRAPLTYGRLFTQVETIAATLKAQGLGAQDRVAIVLPNGPEMAVAFLSVSCVGTSAPLLSSYPAKEFDFYFSDLCPKALLIQSGLDSPARRVARARDIPIIELSPTKEEPAGVFSIEGGRPLRSLQEGNVASHHVALVLYTSGTTSQPKLVPLTHVNVCTSALNTATTLKLTEQDRCLNVMPLFHIHGLVGALLSSFVSGGCVVCTSGCNGPDFFDWMKSFSPTWYTAVPTIHQEVLRWAPDYPTHLASHQLRFIRSSSSALPIWAMQKLEELFKVPVIEAYGMTEAAHQMASNLLPPHSRKPGSVGKAAGPEVAIMDEVGNFLSPGFTGEIVIRGMNVIVGYEGNAVANEQAFTHKWFRTGDQGYVDTDGYFFITGRLKEVINRGGEKVSPREVDVALMEHPAVDQAATYAIPHPTLGEEVAAAVVLRQDHSVTKKDIQRFLVKRLAGFKVPHRLNFVGEIPKGPTGKVNRMGLGDLLATQPKDTTVTPRNPVEAEVARIWGNFLQLDRVGIYDDFFELGGDSLLAIQLISTLNQKFGKGLSWETLLQAPTVAELAKLLQEEHLSTSSSAVVPLQTNGSRAPFFCVHPIEGHVFQLRNLGFALGLDQPLYGLQARGLDGHSKPYTRVEDMATRYIEDIQAIQPEGPYYLGGHCFGGLVAFEMARQLTIQGHQVKLLALIDTYAPGYSLFWPTVRTLLRQSYEMMQIIVSEAKTLFRSQEARENSQRLIKAALRKMWTRARNGWGYLFQLYLRLKGFLFVHPWRNVQHANQRAWGRYRPLIYSGSATLIRAQDKHNWSYFDPQLGWGALVAGKLAICETPGYLESLVRGNRVQVLGSILRKFLPTVQGEDLSLGYFKNDASQLPGEPPSADVLKREKRAEGSTNSIQFISSDNSSNNPQTSPWEPKPFYFRMSEKPLYGSYLRPSSNISRTCGIVLCYPMGQEYLWSHRTFRQLAIGLSRVGFPVLRFDFTGCGDSEGDCDQWRIQQWKTDIESGLVELKTRGEVKNVCLIGLRLGATLARMVGVNREDIEGMVLWDPVINGMDYVAELISQQQKHLVRYGGVPQNLIQENEDQEVIGFTLTKNFLADLQAINPLTVSSQYAKKTLFIQSTEIAYGKDIENQIKKCHPLVTFQHLPSNPIWIKGDGLTRKLVPQNIINSVVSWTAEALK